MLRYQQWLTKRTILQFKLLVFHPVFMEIAVFQVIQLTKQRLQFAFVRLDGYQMIVLMNKSHNWLHFFWHFSLEMCTSLHYFHYFIIFIHVCFFLYSGADRYYLEYIELGTVKLLFSIMACFLVWFPVLYVLCMKAETFPKCIAWGGCCSCCFYLVVVIWWTVDWILIASNAIHDGNGYGVLKDMWKRERIKIFN